MAGSNSWSLGDIQRAPEHLGSKVSTESSLNDFLCCSCGFPVVNARQSGCGCRLCEPCFKAYKSKSIFIFTCGKCLLTVDINETFRDRASDNELKRKSFPCFNQDCPWIGGAFDYRDHISQCAYGSAVCSNFGCNEVIPRNQVKDHEAVCQFRIFICQWCKKELALKDKTTHEAYECQELQMKCPVGCGETMRKKDVKEHTDHYCKKQTRLCRFKRYGCTTKGNSESLEVHSKDNVHKHLELLLEGGHFATAGETRGIQSSPGAKDREISRLQRDLQALERDLRIQYSELDTKLESLTMMMGEVQTSFNELSTLVQTLQATSYNGQFVWKIPEVKRRIKDAVMGKTLSLYSAPFYTGRFGYKMCLRVYLNGDGSGKGKYISFFLTLMRGEYDALLSWPFSQMVTLSLLDQNQNKKKHITQCFKPEPSSSSFWRPNSEMNIASGCPKFAPLTVLSEFNSSYVQDDVMFFKASIDLAGLSQP